MQESNHAVAQKLLIELSGNKGMVTVPRVYLEIFDGDYPKAVVLNQLVFWSDKGNIDIKKEGFEGGGWFYKSYATWQEETGLSEYQVRRCLKYFKERGYLQMTRRKVNGSPTLHLRFFFDPYLKDIGFLIPKILGNEPAKISETIETRKTSETIKIRSKEDKINNIKESPDGEPVVTKPPKEKPKTQYIQNMERVEQFYADERRCSPPDWSTRKGGDLQKAWRTPLKQILEECNGDIVYAEMIIKASIKKQIEQDLTTTDPRSILKTAKSLIYNQRYEQGRVKDFTTRQTTT